MDIGSEIRITLPSTWQEMTQKKLKTFFSLLAKGFPLDEIQVHCFLIFSGIRVLTRIDDKVFFCKYGKNTIMLKTIDVAASSRCLDFMQDIPLYPVRIENYSKHRALPADLSGVPFKIWLSLENYYQGYLQTQNKELLLQMSRLLYPSLIDCEDYLLMSTFYWFASLKTYYSLRFSFFFKPFDFPSSGALEQKSIGQKLQESIDSQIRALTKGDILKEDEILECDTLRALTELNALSRDYEEIKKTNK